MVYWLNAAAASSARLYWHSLASSVGTFDKVPAPSAYSRFPADNVALSERWARTRYTDLRYYGTLLAATGSGRPRRGWRPRGRARPARAGAGTRSPGRPGRRPGAPPPGCPAPR